MATIKEWECAAHGPFESDKPECPRGCSGGQTIQRRFYSAPGLTGGRTKNIDRTLESLARDYGLTDMNNHGGTTAAMPRPRIDPDFTPRWGQVAPGGTYQVGKGVVNADRGLGALASMAPFGGGGNSLESIQGLVPPRPQIHGVDRTPLDTARAPD